MVTRYLPGEHPGCYFDPDDWRYRPCIRDDEGRVTWAAELITYWNDNAATQHAKRKAFRNFIAANPLWFDDDDRMEGVQE